MKRAVGYQDVVSSGTRLVGTICAVFCVSLALAFLGR